MHIKGSVIIGRLWVRSQQATILTGYFQSFSLVTPSKFWDGTFNIGPGRHLPEFSLLSCHGVQSNSCLLNVLLSSPLLYLFSLWVLSLLPEIRSKVVVVRYPSVLLLLASYENESTHCSSFAFRYSYPVSRHCYLGYD